MDWERGVDEWVDDFYKALKLSRYDECRVLLEIRNELVIQSDFELGSVSQSEGDYFANLAQYQQAEQEYKEAIASYNQALNRAPDYINAHNNKGLALQSLGKLQAGLSQQEETLKNYQAALAEFNCSLEIAPNDEQIRNIRDKLQELFDDFK